MARASILVEHVILCNMDHIANWPRVFVRMIVEFETTCAINISCKFESHSSRGALDTTLCDKVCRGHATGRWFCIHIFFCLSLNNILFQMIWQKAVARYCQNLQFPLC
jgi:hypothetical protein